MSQKQQALFMWHKSSHRAERQKPLRVARPLHDDKGGVERLQIEIEAKP